MMKISINAWLRIVSLRDCGDTEIGGYGLVDAKDPSTIIDFLMPKQQCNSAYCEFDDASVAKLTDDMVALNIAPNRFLRVWIHTHPGSSPSPSGKDETTFKEFYDESDWSVMIIIAKDNSSYCKVKHTTGVRMETECKLVLDYSKVPAFSFDPALIKAEYAEKVSPMIYTTVYGNGWNHNDWEGYGRVTTYTPVQSTGIVRQGVTRTKYGTCSVCHKKTLVFPCVTCLKPTCYDCSISNECETCFATKDPSLHTVKIETDRAGRAPNGGGVCSVCGKKENLVYKCDVCGKDYCISCEHDKFYCCINCGGK